MLNWLTVLGNDGLILRFGFVLWLILLAIYKSLIAARSHKVLIAEEHQL